MHCTVQSMDHNMSRSLSPAHPLVPPVGSRFARRCATFEHVFGLPAKTFLDALAEISPDFARHATAGMPATLLAMQTAKYVFASMPSSEPMT